MNPCLSQLTNELWLQKKVESEVFLKSKHQYHLSQREECFYGAQSWKERRLLCESMFIPNDGRTLIIKIVEREVFFMEPKHQCQLS